MQIKACLFDVFGTLTDWRSGVSTVAGPIFAELGIAVPPAEFAARWRAEYQPSMERVRAGGRQYTALEHLHLENLDIVLAEYGVSLPAPARHRLNAAWSKLPVWQDVPDPLLRLRNTHLVAPCSNGSVSMMVGIARHNALHWDFIGGAPLARAYKPMLEVYVQSVAAFGLQPEDVMMIAAHNDDLEAAQSAGLATGFFPRPTEYGAGQITDLSAERDWDIVAPDFPTLVSCLTD